MMDNFEKAQISNASSVFELNSAIGQVFNGSKITINDITIIFLSITQ